jgi:hypothetical protein
MVLLGFSYHTICCYNFHFVCILAKWHHGDTNHGTIARRHFVATKQLEAHKLMLIVDDCWFECFSTVRIIWLICTTWSMEDCRSRCLGTTLLNSTDQDRDSDNSCYCCTKWQMPVLLIDLQDKNDSLTKQNKRFKELNWLTPKVLLPRNFVHGWTKFVVAAARLFWNQMKRLKTTLSLSLQNTLHWMHSRESPQPELLTRSPNFTYQFADTWKPTMDNHNSASQDAKDDQTITHVNPNQFSTKPTKKKAWCGPITVSVCVNSLDLDWEIVSDCHMAWLGASAPWGRCMTWSPDFGHAGQYEKMEIVCVTVTPRRHRWQKGATRTFNLYNLKSVTRNTRCSLKHALQWGLHTKSH